MKYALIAIALSALAAGLSLPLMAEEGPTPPRRGASRQVASPRNAVRRNAVRSAIRPAGAREVRRLHQEEVESETLPEVESARASEPDTRRIDDSENVEPWSEAIAPPAANADSAEPLTLAEVLVATDDAFPLLIAAEQQRSIAAGDQLTAAGAFDLNLSGTSMLEPLGFYKNYRSGFLMEQPTWPGGKVFAGYRVGRGVYEPWYLERETNLGGEFSVGVRSPLLRDLAIDKRRAALRKAALGRQLADPAVGKARVESLKAAASAYWKWVGAGLAYRVADQLLAVAEQRVDAIRQLIDEQRLASIEGVDNDRLIAARQAKLYEADRKWRQAAVELSLYFRDETGEPVLPPASRLPDGFPDPELPTDSEFNADVRLGLETRPELVTVRLLREQVGVDLAAARNQLLPSLDVSLLSSQDVGAPASAKRDKSPFEMEAGLYLEVPLQRRQARGQVRASQAKAAQLNAQERFLRDRVVADIESSRAALTTSYFEWLQAVRGVDLAERLERAEELRLSEGRTNVFTVNLREQQTFDARLLVFDALEEFHRARAEYRAAIGVDALPEVR